MGFLFPAGLAAAALALPLVALYFLRLRRERIVVSSLAPWRDVRRSEALASPFHKFRRHLLLWLQLAALAAAVFALGRPFVETDAVGYRSVVLVIDTSASMGATDGAPTRLDAARAEAEHLVDGLEAADEVMVVEAGPRTAVVLPFSRDRGAAHRALDALAVTEAEGGLEDGLTLAVSLAKTRPDVTIVMLSDGGPRSLAAVASEGAVRYVRIGTSDANAGIVALDLRQSPASELDQQLFVTIASYGKAPAAGAVEVYLDDRLVGLRNTALAPEAPVSMVFDVPATGAGILRAELHVPGDLLPADDVAWAVVAPRRPRDVLLVGGDALLAKILGADPRIRASRVGEGAVTPEVLAAADVVLFAGAVPDGVDGRRYAVLGPWPGAPVKFGAPRPTPRVTGWQRSHPILRYTRWDDLTVARASPVVDRAGLVPIVDGDAGPLVLAGERNGGRVVQLAFDPLASDLPLRVAWPVFVTNVVGWLLDEGGAGPATHVRTGEALVLPVSETDAEAAITVDGPRNLRATGADGAVRLTGLDGVGVYRVTAGDARLTFAANLLSEAESRIAPRSALDLAPRRADAPSAEAATARRPLWRLGAMLALGVLVLEGSVWALRRTA